MIGAISKIVEKLTYSTEQLSSRDQIIQTCNQSSSENLTDATASEYEEKLSDVDAEAAAAEAERIAAEMQEIISLKKEISAITDCLQLLHKNFEGHLDKTIETLDGCSKNFIEFSEKNPKLNSEVKLHFDREFGKYKDFKTEVIKYFLDIFSKQELGSVRSEWSIAGIDHDRFMKLGFTESQFTENLIKKSDEEIDSFAAAMENETKVDPEAYYIQIILKICRNCTLIQSVLVQLETNNVFRVQFVNHVHRQFQTKFQFIQRESAKRKIPIAIMENLLVLIYSQVKIFKRHFRIDISSMSNEILRPRYFTPAVMGPPPVPRNQYSPRYPYPPRYQARY